MVGHGDKVVCATPTPGKATTRITAWKYETVRRAVLDALADRPEGVAFRELPRLVEERLGAEQRTRLGSVPWYTTMVKLDLEVRGEIERIGGVTPQHLRLAAG